MSELPNYRTQQSRNGLAVIYEDHSFVRYSERLDETDSIRRYLTWSTPLQFGSGLLVAMQRQHDRSPFTGMLDVVEALSGSAHQVFPGTSYAALSRTLRNAHIDYVDGFGFELSLNWQHESKGHSTAMVPARNIFEANHALEFNDTAMITALLEDTADFTIKRAIPHALGILQRRFPATIDNQHEPY